MQITMKLEKAAQKTGGDKYVGNHDGQEVSFYVPQSISRIVDGKPLPKINVEITAA